MLSTSLCNRRRVYRFTFGLLMLKQVVVAFSRSSILQRQQQTQPGPFFFVASYRPPQSNLFLHVRPSPSSSDLNLPDSSTTTAIKMSSSKLDSPSAERNKEPIWHVMSTKVIPGILANSDDDDQKPKTMRIVEIAAGSGVHTEYFALNLLQYFCSGGDRDNSSSPLPSSFKWYPTDPDEQSRKSIQCYMDDQQDKLGDYVQPPMPLTLDKNGITEESTRLELSSSPTSPSIDLIVCINMIHISPWDATIGLMKLAGQTLSEHGVLYCYGPYKEGGTAVESNLDFDTNLRSRNPLWGVRDLESVVEVANQEGLELEEKIVMPANNLSLLFRRRR